MKKGKFFLVACMIAAGSCLYVQPSGAQTPGQTTSESQSDWGRNDGAYDGRRDMSPWWGLLGLIGLFGLAGKKRHVERNEYSGQRPATARP